MAFQMTEGEYRLHREEYSGICLACGAIRYGDTEPDAEDYPCDDCGKERVTGIDNALISGDIELI